MRTTLNESGPSSPQNFNWLPTGSAIFNRNEADDLSTDLHRKGEAGSNPPSSQILPRLFYELAVWLPRLRDVQLLCIWRFQPERRSIQLHVGLGEGSTTLRSGLDFPLDESVANWVWEHQHHCIITTESESRFPEFARLLLDRGIKSFCAFPLMIADNRIGVLGLASTEPDAFRGFNLEIVQRRMAEIADTTCGMNLPEPKAHLGNAALRLDEEISPENNFEGIIGNGKPVQSLRREIKVVAPTSSTVLILGETGTGKELVARAIHNLSPRCKSPFIKVNCAAIPAGLLESELFGHERGAFTGAIGKRTGRFEMAHGGTLFLDEIGDIPLELQPKLLRVLQEQEFERLGGTVTTRVDVRVVAATSRDLPRMVAAKEFRGDLYYRLNVFPLRVAPLRERADDIDLLVRHFVDVHAKRMGRRIEEVPMESMHALSRYSWPGNIRELQNVIERAVILSPGKNLRLPLDDLRGFNHQTVANGQGTEGKTSTLKDLEREHILQALAATNWVLGGPAGAGARLGLARTTLIGKMQRLGITRAQA